jgi:IMP dehydrogenase
MHKIQDLEGYDFKDAYIIPQYSTIGSRSEVDISVVLRPIGLKIYTPVISANMDTVTGADMAIAMFKAGGIGALHRFMPIEENVSSYSKVRQNESDCLVSVGVNRDSKERAKALYDAGARLFVIDIAHGHSLMMKEMATWIKSELPDIFLMAGNVATRQATSDLRQWGADAIKVGIGPGAVCLTKNVTGVTVPQLGAIQACASEWNPSTGPLIVADGGIREFGDIAKAVGVGAHMVMAGGLFAGTDEAPGDLVEGKKVYRGMASKGAMMTIRSESMLPTPEGTSTLVETKGPVGDIVRGIAGGLRSAFSYSNARNLKEFHNNVFFGIRKGH